MRNLLLANTLCTKSPVHNPEVDCGLNFSCSSWFAPLLFHGLQKMVLVGRVWWITTEWRVTWLTVYTVRFGFVLVSSLRLLDLRFYPVSPSKYARVFLWSSFNSQITGRSLDSFLETKSKHVKLRQFDSESSSRRAAIAIRLWFARFESCVIRENI